MQPVAEGLADSSSQVLQRRKKRVEEETAAKERQEQYARGIRPALLRLEEVLSLEATDTFHNWTHTLLELGHFTNSCHRQVMDRFRAVAVADVDPECKLAFSLIADAASDRPTEIVCEYVRELLKPSNADLFGRVKDWLRYARDVLANGQADLPAGPAAVINPIRRAFGEPVPLADGEIAKQSMAAGETGENTAQAVNVPAAEGDQTRPPIGSGIPREKAIRLVDDYIRAHQNDSDKITVNAIQKATRVSSGQISSIPSWKKYHRDRKGAKSKKHVKGRSLTASMLATIPGPAHSAAEEAALHEEIEKQRADNAEEDSFPLRRERSRRERGA